MATIRSALALARSLAAVTGRRRPSTDELFEALVTHPQLREATESLFRAREYARAVEQGEKALIDHVQQVTSGTAEGAPLMEWAFSEKNPVIRVNEGKTKAERDEQTGYMFIMKGSVFLIRNPRVHNHRLVDTPDRALSLLGFTNHLFEVIDSSEVVQGVSAPHP